MGMEAGIQVRRLGVMMGGSGLVEGFGEGCVVSNGDNCGGNLVILHSDADLFLNI